MKKSSFLFLTITLVFLTCVISCNDYLYDMLKEKPDNAIKYETKSYDLDNLSAYGSEPYTITVKTYMSDDDPPPEPPYSTQSYTVGSGNEATLNLPQGQNRIEINGNPYDNIWVCLFTFVANDDAAYPAVGVPPPRLVISSSKMLTTDDRPEGLGDEVVHSPTRDHHTFTGWDTANGFFDSLSYWNMGDDCFHRTEFVFTAHWEPNP